MSIDDPSSKPDTYAVTDEDAVVQLGADLAEGRKRIFFYVASGFDWQPLHRFSHLCDCFVYVDPRAGQVEWETHRRELEDARTMAGGNLKGAQLLAVEEAYRDLTGVVGPLAQMQYQAWAQIPAQENRTAWGAVQMLKRRVGGEDRITWLLLIAGDPLFAYRRLFIQTGTAPIFLALCRPDFPVPVEGLAEFQNQWEEFAGWNGQIGQLLRDNGAPLPRFLVNDGNTMGWPTVATRYRIPHWRRRWFTNIDTLDLEAWPALAPAAAAGARRIVLTRSPINPFLVREAGAVVLSNEKYRQYRWPDGVVAILNGPPIFEEQAIPDGPNAVNINIVAVPLLEALARIEAVCAERGITKVAVQGLPGFEDEADDLALWRQRDGPIRELTIYCECDGHFIDFAPAADQIG